MENLTKLREEVGNLVAAGRLDLALRLIADNDQLFRYSKSSEVILLTARFNRLQNQSMVGTIDTRDELAQRNQIISSILELCSIDRQKVKIPPLQTASLATSSGVSFKAIKGVLKPLCAEDNTINYYAAIEAISELF